MLPKGKLGVGPPNPFLRIFQYLRVGEIQQENNTLKVTRKRKKTSNTAMLKPVASSSNPISLSLSLSLSLWFVWKHWWVFCIVSLKTQKALMVLYMVSLSKRKSTNSLFMLVDVEKHEAGIYREFRGSRECEVWPVWTILRLPFWIFFILFYFLFFQSSNFNSFAFFYFFIFCLLCHHGKR